MAVARSAYLRFRAGATQLRTHRQGRTPESTAALPRRGLDPIWADHDRLEQVFVNLVDNALRHTPPGTPVGVRAGRGDRPDTVAVRVSDRGPGLPSGSVERLFQPYVRGPEGGPGAGLGLSIARGIVEAHGGTVTLEPVPVGTCFLVTLPTIAEDTGVWEPRVVEERV